MWKQAVMSGHSATRYSLYHIGAWKIQQQAMSENAATMQPRYLVLHLRDAHLAVPLLSSRSFFPADSRSRLGAEPIFGKPCRSSRQRPKPRSPLTTSAPLGSSPNLAPVLPPLPPCARLTSASSRSSAATCSSTSAMVH